MSDLTPAELDTYYPPREPDQFGFATIHIPGHPAGIYVHGDSIDVCVARARRIAGSLNACAGIPDEQLTAEDVGALLETLQLAHTAIELLHTMQIAADPTFRPANSTTSVALARIAAILTSHGRASA